MYPNILDPNQLKLLPFLAQFYERYYLVGGTALALQIGHRRSIDFDLFTNEMINFEKLSEILNSASHHFNITYQDGDQIQGILDQVRVTFYQYPFNIKSSVIFNDHIFRMPNVLDIATMKAYALGRRAKWKDYVDMYYIFNYHESIERVIARSQEIYGSLFSEKLFRQQLSYFQDIDSSEKVDFISKDIPDQQIQDFLIDISTNI